MIRFKDFLRPFLNGCAILLAMSFIPLAYAGDAVHKLNMTRSEFNTQHATHAVAGRRLMDIDIRWTGSEERYNAIWYPTTASVHTLIQGTSTDWSNFISSMQPKNGRYLDVEVGYFGGSKRYSALFYEDGDDYGYALHTTDDDASFQGHLAQYLNQGRAIIDFEAYTDNNGNTKFGGVWVNDPNQPMTTLYYGLEWNDVGDLINPRIGRVIDLEYYYSSIHGENRWAMIFAMSSGGEQFQRRGDSATAIGNKDTDFSDSNTDMIDIESYKINGVVRYIALWGDTFKSLQEVDQMQADSDQEPLPVAISNLVSQFETAGNPAVIGVYAKNMRTNQSIAYRKNEPFYMASTAKIPIHIKYWREIQNGHLDATTSINYTASASSRSPWYTGDRSNGLGINNFGQSFTLRQYDTFMMSVSDNAATSLLMDEPTIGLTRDSYDVNEWLADISGVGQGWGLVTSIQDVDRNIMWQGQVDAFPSASSYFPAPPSALEAHWRWGDPNGDGVSNVADDDWWGDLQAYYGVSSVSNLPSYSGNTGRRRYFSQGLNTATPKATALLLERLAEGSLLNAATTQSAITSMTEGSSLDGANAWPGYVNVWSKGGSKGRASASLYAISDAGIFDLGPDAIAVAVLTEWNGGASNTVSRSNVRNNFTNPIGFSLLQSLGADLHACSSAAFIGPSTLSPGENFNYGCYIPNSGGGDAGPFEVHFYASRNTTITTDDTYLGYSVVPGLAGGATAFTKINTTLRSLPVGEYYIGWIIDPLVGDVNPACNRGIPGAGSVAGMPPPDRFGAVGEYDECNNFGFDAVNKLIVPDITPPAIQIINRPGVVSNTDTYKLTFQFSEDVTGFLLSDIAVGNGSVDNFIRVDANTYTAEILPSGAGNISIDIAQGAAQDGASNGSDAVYAVTRFDSTNPTITIQSSPGSIINTSSFNLRFKFSEWVSTFFVDDIVVTNGTASNLNTTDAISYTATITPTDADDVVVDIPAGAAKDAAGNLSNAADQVVITFNDAPVFTSPAHFVFRNHVSTVAQITAIDDENDLLTFSIIGGIDQARVIMSPAGLLSFDTPPDIANPLDHDRNNEYLVDIQAFDGRNASAQMLTITAKEDESCSFIVIPVERDVDEPVDAPDARQKASIICL